jgi:hypothetical protein
VIFEKIDYLTKKKEYNGVVRVTYDVEAEEEDTDEIEL